MKARRFWEGTVIKWDGHWTWNYKLQDLTYDDSDMDVECN